METSARILVVDDEVHSRTALAALLREEGYLAETAGDGFKALARIEETRPDLVITDLRMPSMDGFELIRRLRRQDVDVPVVVMTAFGSVDSAVEAMRDGAVDFIVKPLEAELLLGTVERALRSRRPGEPLEPRATLPGFVCNSPEMRELSQRARRAAACRASVLIRGEPGAGRERLARALHALSRHADGAFVRLDCGSMAERFALDAHGLRSELARSVAQAAGGALYLRDVQALPLAGQGALLDVMPSRHQNGTSVRVIASSDCDLRALAAAGSFRQDLAWQLHVIELGMPPLRERRADVAILAAELLAERGPGRSLGRDAVAALESHRWPGNFPELRAALERAATTSSGVIRSEHLGLLRAQPTTDRPPSIPGATLAEIERYAILKTLESQRGSTSRAARVLGMSVRKIQYKLNEYGTTRSHPGGALAE